MKNTIKYCICAFVIIAFLCLFLLHPLPNDLRIFIKPESSHLKGSGTDIVYEIINRNILQCSVAETLPWDNSIGTRHIKKKVYLTMLQRKRICDYIIQIKKDSKGITNSSTGVTTIFIYINGDLYSSQIVKAHNDESKYDPSFTYDGALELTTTVAYYNTPQLPDGLEWHKEFYKWISRINGKVYPLN